MALPHTTAAGRVQQLEQQLRSAQQQRQEAELQLHYATEEAQELRAAKESAVVEKEQVAVRSERRSQAHEVRCDKEIAFATHQLHCLGAGPALCHQLVLALGGGGGGEGAARCAQRAQEPGSRGAL